MEQKILLCRYKFITVESLKSLDNLLQTGKYGNVRGDII